MKTNIEDKMPDITNAVTNTTLNAKINEVKGEIPNITSFPSYYFYYYYYYYYYYSY